MATSLAVTVTSNLAAALTQVNVSGNTTLNLNLAPGATLADGTAADQVDKIYTASPVIVPGTPLLLNMSTLNAATDIAGNAFLLLRIKFLAFLMLGNAGVFTESDVLTLGGAASNPWLAPFGSGTDKLKLYSGTVLNPGFMILSEGGATGWVVPTGGGAANILQLANGGANPFAVQIVVVGADA